VSDHDAAERKKYGEAVLAGCMAALAEVLELADPVGMARAVRIQHLAGALGRAYGLTNVENFEQVAFLSQIGTLILPAPVAAKLHSGELLTENERKMVRRMPEVADRLLAKIPGTEAARHIIRLQNVHIQEYNIPDEAHVLRVVIGFDRLDASGESHESSLRTMRSRDPMYFAGVLNKLESYLASPGQIDASSRNVLVGALTPGMTVLENVMGTDDRLLLRSGVRLTPSLIAKLTNMAELNLIRNAVLVSGPEP
jgi:hypothetical protein